MPSSGLHGYARGAQTGMMHAVTHKIKKKKLKRKHNQSIHTPCSEYNIHKLHFFSLICRLTHWQVIA